VFGFKEFRFGQYEALRSLLAGQNTLFISETGSGKSLTYYMGALLLGGLVVVVSPLISLMMDQIQHLPSCIPAACISSALHRGQVAEIVRLVRRGQVALLFITPECMHKDFVCQMESFPEVSLLVIDEVHCLSEQSHNYRFAYSMLLALTDKYMPFAARRLILGLTATSNSQTRAELEYRLAIKETVQAPSLRRRNLAVTISRDKDKFQALLRYLAQPHIRPLKGILIYARSKYYSSTIHNVLVNSGLKAATYNSDVSHSDKLEITRRFLKGELPILVSTVALGMGVDFANVDCVIHMNMPKTIENYIQEIGRAGRDPARPAYCHLFLSDSDYIVERNFTIANRVDHALLQRFLAAVRSFSYDSSVDQPPVCPRPRLVIVNAKDFSESLDLPLETVCSLLLRLGEQTRSLALQPSSFLQCELTFFSQSYQQVKDADQFFRRLAGLGTYKKGVFRFLMAVAANELSL
jgi:ATP-dependent DNA helicase Q4